MSSEQLALRWSRYQTNESAYSTRVRTLVFRRDQRVVGSVIDAVGAEKPFGLMHARAPSLEFDENGIYPSCVIDGGRVFAD
jgi:hypothetical protein